MHGGLGTEVKVGGCEAFQGQVCWLFPLSFSVRLVRARGGGQFSGLNCIYMGFIGSVCSTLAPEVFLDPGGDGVKRVVVFL